MAFMNPKALFTNFDGARYFSKVDEPERCASRLSYSPSQNILAVVTLDGAVEIFTGRNTTPENDLQSFKPYAKISLPDDEATCVYLLTVTSKKSSIIGGSWCSVVVGTKCGNVLFHNEEGLLLIRQALFGQPVSSVCASISAHLQGYVYASSASSIDVVVYGELVPELESHLNSALLSPSKANVQVPLNWKNLRLQQVKNTQQISLTHHGSPECYFDLLERCTIDRHSVRGELSNAINLQVSSVGADPFYNLTVSREVSQTNLVSDIAVAVANKFTRMLSDNVPFWGSKSNAPTEAELAPKISNLNVLHQHGIFDRDRLGTSMCVSPSKRFIALVDSLARVVLMDAGKGTPLYVMKGYRKAQLGWITSSSLDGSGRTLELLVIYCAKSMQLELWNTRKATRVTAFSAPGGAGFLVYDSGSIAAGNEDDFPPEDHQAYFITKGGLLYDIRILFSEALEFEDLAEMQGHLDDLAEIREILLQYSPERLARFERLLKRFKRVSLLQQILKLVCDCDGVDGPLIDCVVRTLKGKNFRGARKATERLQKNLSKIERVVCIFDHLKENAQKPFEDELSELPHCSDLDALARYQNAFQYYDTDNDIAFSLEQVKLCDFLNSFAVLSDSKDSKIIAEKYEEHQHLVADCLIAAAADESLFRLLKELDVCLWSITSNLLSSLFSTMTNDTDKCSRTYTVLRSILNEMRAHDESIEPFLHLVYEEISTTENVPAAILASYMMRCALDVERHSLLDEVEEPLECRIFNGLFKQLQSILSLAALLRCRVLDPSLSSNPCARMFPISLNGLRKSEGHISYIVSQWICEQRLTHEHLTKALNNQPTLTPCLEQSLETPEITLDVALQLLCDVRITFPVSLQLETLLANCCWSYLCLWDKNYEEAEPLDWCLDYLRAIKAFKLKEGLCHMIWKSHLQTRVISLARIVEQTGSLPDAQLIRHVQVGKFVLLNFLNFCSTILDVIIESMLPSEDIELLCPLSEEETLAPGFSEGDPSLISRALSLPQALRETVHLHYSLVTILTYCVQFNLDDIQPLSLFDSAAQSALSEDICEVYTRYNQATSANVALSNLRSTFLRRSIEACVQVLPDSFDSAELNQCQTTVSRLVDLAHSWDIDPDVVKKEYVLQLYSGGHDQLAQEIMCQIGERRAMVAPLMIIIGLRTRSVLGQIDNTTCEKLGAVSTKVNRWIAELPERTLRCTDKSVDSTMSLVQLVLNLVREGDAEEILLNEIILLLTNIQYTMM
ncbi:rab3 GTPase-activating protein non-catalytic subunit [Galendromus occidentalis]|uniref:Rab3 GTPase-activating protein non-catalytic subunit n=1 Tax=Galendromus occidentalis TaxID=34638 RepID=A0AAJ7SEX0_9ACAR|nr:rab3 GTPase-activating protein non-catalytic subunit [Galendromus occidentalis]